MITSLKTIVVTWITDFKIKYALNTNKIILKIVIQYENGGIVKRMKNPD